MTQIIYKKGDLMQASEPCIVHGCNAMGVMGSGVAAAIRKAYPEAYEAYRQEYDLFGLKLGSVYHSYSQGKAVWHAITQFSFGTDRRHVDYGAVEKVMKTINIFAPRDYGFDEVAMPRIGAGLGGGDWDTISAIIEAASTHFQPVVYAL